VRSKSQTMRIDLAQDQKVFFISDLHLGAPDHTGSQMRERTIVQWLESISPETHTLFLVGDLFDFWFEFKQAVPKGYTRLFGQLARMADQGIQIIIFSGNHDMWMGDYFTQEFNALVLREPQTFTIQGKTFWIGHGDGLGPGDYPYKFLKRIFENPICRWMFHHLLHPNLSLRLGYAWARHSWQSHVKKGDMYQYKSPEYEILYHYCQQKHRQDPHDFYIFGHRHLRLDIPIGESSRYVNLGDWIQLKTFASFDGNNLELKSYSSD